MKNTPETPPATTPFRPAAGLALLAALTLLTGCPTHDSSKVAVEDRTEAPEQADSAARGPNGDDTRTQGLGDDAIQVTGLEEKRTDLLEQRSIYFEFDSDTIQAEYREVVEAHAAYLTANRNPSLVLEGHADERGTREYNLALGERRGLAIKRLLTLLGVPGSRVRVISYGEERPYAHGNDEESWRLNRRVDLVY